MVPEKWDEVMLGKLSSETISYGIVQTGEHIDDGIPCIRVVDMASGNLDSDCMIRTSLEVHNSYKKTILKQGDIMFALPGEIGLVKKVPEDLVGCNLTRGVARVSPDATLVDSRYLLWALRSTVSRRDMLRRVNGSALQEIPLSELRKVKVLNPRIDEQRRLASILDTWETAITSLERLVDSSQTQKKALMQQLLTGKRRLPGFDGEWVDSRLREFLIESKVRNAGEKVGRVLSVSNKHGFILPEDQFSKRVASDNVSNYRVVQRGQYAYNPSRINVGSFARLDHFENGVVSPMYVVFGVDAKRLDNDYYSHWMDSHQAKGRISNLTQGSVRDSVSFDALGSLPINVPSLAEQKAIAAVLSQADRETQLLLEQLAKLQTEKKALMQQLLTGKRRVNVDKDAV